MPSLVSYAHEILSEDRYGYKALARVDDRIQSLNNAQLDGMIAHLSGSMTRAQGALWREANRSVLARVAVEHSIREDEKAKFDSADYHDNKEERQAEEEEALRRAEHEAAEKQIVRTAERLAKEYVAAVTRELEQKEMLDMMDRTYQAR